MRPGVIDKKIHPAGHIIEHGPIFQIPSLSVGTVLRAMTDSPPYTPALTITCLRERSVRPVLSPFLTPLAFT